MTRRFIEKIINERVVDTKKYRYIYSEDRFKAQIRRLPLKHMNQKLAIQYWDLVTEWRI